MESQSNPELKPAPLVAPESQRPRRAELDDRDRAIIGSIAAGHSNRTIARQMQISEQTVKNRLTAIYQILGVKTRLELAVRSLKGGGNGRLE